MESQDVGPRKNKRPWTEEEDEKLVETLLEFYDSGKYNAENGFKPGLNAAIEKALERKLSGSNIKAKPHIESRMKTLRSNFSIVHDMLTGKDTSGFGWDPERKVVTTSKDVWHGYLKVYMLDL